MDILQETGRYSIEKRNFIYFDKIYKINYIPKKEMIFCRIFKYWTSITQEKFNPVTLTYSDFEFNCKTYERALEIIELYKQGERFRTKHISPSEILEIN